MGSTQVNTAGRVDGIDVVGTAEAGGTAEVLAAEAVGVVDPVALPMLLVRVITEDVDARVDVSGREPDPVQPTRQRG